MLFLKKLRNSLLPDKGGPANGSNPSGKKYKPEEAP
jgi:hypothetical protein